MSRMTSGVSVLRRIAPVLLLGTMILAIARAQSTQDETEDITRRLWNKKFETARTKNKRSEPPRESPRSSNKTPTSSKPISPAEQDKPQQSAIDKIDGELIGVTFWRLRNTASPSDQNSARLLLQKENGQKGESFAERVAADTVFNEGQLVRFSIEAARGDQAYLYVIDRELYADGTTSDAYVIFPTTNTPAGGNVLEAGKVVYVPAQEESPNYFRLQRSRRDHTSELLTIVVSPKPLQLKLGTPDNPLKLEKTQLADWEKLWGGKIDRRELRNALGQLWTKKEKEAGEGTRRLIQGDPLPQTVYNIAAKADGAVLFNIPLRMAP